VLQSAGVGASLSVFFSLYSVPAHWFMKTKDFFAHLALIAHQTLRNGVNLSDDSLVSPGVLFP
jgi:hypothetical protein